MTNINEVTNCYGCFACMNKCPKQCIHLVKNKLGHFYPHATDECIKCQACLKVCPSINEFYLKQPIEVYAATDKNYKSEKKSSSGGIATILSQAIIEKGGIVYGCSFQNGFQFKHIRCNKFNELEKLRGSKYVQSNISDTYKLIEKDLKDKKKVLFIGTPCQVNAIKLYFNNNILLYTIDLLCHGVPSTEILKASLPKYIPFNKITEIKFREKENYQIKLFENEKLIYTCPLSRNLFLKGFFTNIFNRNSCFTCKYATQSRTGDISLGDFWGLHDITFKDIKGISLCLINSEKGKTLYSNIENRIFSTRHTIEEALPSNKPLNFPSRKNLNIRIFQTLYPILGYRLSIFFSMPGIIIKSFILNLIK